MKVFVTGGTGLIGKALVEELLSRGHTPVLLTRNVSKLKKHDACEYVEWDLAQSVLPAAQIVGVEGAINMAGESIAGQRWSESRKQKLRNSRVQLTKNLVSSLNEAGVNSLVSFSATGFYGDRGDEILTEESQAGEGFLGNLASDWEHAAKTFTGRLCIPRVGVVLARDGGALEKLAPVFKMGLGGPIGNGTQWMSWIHLRDVVNLVCFLLETRSVEGVFNAVSPEPATNAEFSKTLAQQFHRPSVLKVPSFAMKLALGEMSEVLLSSQRAIPQRTLASGFQYEFPDLKSAFHSLYSK